MMECRVLCIFLFFLVLCNAEPRRYVSEPKSCHAKGNRFQHGRRHVYEYRTTVEVGVSGTTNQTAGSELTCQVWLEVPRRCEAVMKLSDCQIVDHGPSGGAARTYKNNELSKLLSRYTVYLQLDSGMVAGGRLVVYKKEPSFVLNLKRAIISALQLKTMEKPLYETPVQYFDIFGDCPIVYTLPKDYPGYVHTRRDMTKCQIPEKSYYQTSLHSLIKTIQSPASELLDSTLTCQYKVTSSGKLLRSSCQQQVAFSPLAYNGTVYATAMANISHVIIKKNVEQLKALHIDRSLHGRKEVDMMFEIENEDKPVTTRNILFSARGIKDRNTASRNQLGLQRFSSLVATLRRAKEKVLLRAIESIWGCRKKKKCQWEQTTFLDALLSCGTEACVGAFVNVIHRNRASRARAYLFLYDLALNHRPSENIIKKVLTVCQSGTVSGCWLPLGTMINKAVSSNQSSKHFTADGPVFTVLHHLRKLMKDNCRKRTLVNLEPQTRRSQGDDLLLAIKTVGNIGKATQIVYDNNTVAEKRIIPAILRCVASDEIPNEISRAAVVALRKMEFTTQIRDELMYVLRTKTSDSAIRMLLFGILVRQEDESTLKELMDAIDMERSKHFKTYMLTHLNGIMESEDHLGLRLRHLWRKVFVRDSWHIWALPRKHFRASSQYIEISKEFTIPVVNLPFGGQLELDLMLNPPEKTNMLIIRLSVTGGNTKIHLVEVGFDIEGCEELVALILGKASKIGKEPATFFKYMVERLTSKDQDKGKFSYFQQDIVKNIVSLMKTSKLSLENSLKAGLFLRVLDNDIGYTSIKDIMEVGLELLPEKRDKRSIASYFRRLQNSLYLNLDIGRFEKRLDYLKVTPTIAGIPLVLTMDATSVVTAGFISKANVKRFLRRKGPLSGSVELDDLHSRTQFLGKMVAHLNKYSSVGIEIQSSGIIQAGSWGISAAYHLPTDGPYHQKHGLDINLDVPPSSKSFKLTSDMYFVHNKLTSKIETSLLKKTSRICSPSAFNNVIGSELCINLQYQDVIRSSAHPYFPLTGSFKLEADMTPKDKALRQLKSHITFIPGNKKDVTQCCDMNERIINVDFSAVGNHLQRKIEASLSQEENLEAVHFRVAVPEADISYTFNYTWRRPFRKNQTFLFSSVLSYKSAALFAFILNYTDRMDIFTPWYYWFETPEKFYARRHAFHFNVTIPGTSVDICVQNKKTKDMKNKVISFNLKYYCAKERGILYNLHPDPVLADENNQISEFTLSSESVENSMLQSADKCNANERMVISVPGHDILILTNKSENSRKTERDSTVFWSSGGEKKVTSVHSQIGDMGRNGMTDYDFHLEVDQNVESDGIIHQKCLREPKDMQNINIGTNMKRIHPKATKAFVSGQATSKIQRISEVEPFTRYEKLNLGFDVNLKNDGRDITTFHIHVDRPSSEDTLLDTHGRLIWLRNKYDHIKGFALLTNIKSSTNNFSLDAALEMYRYNRQKLFRYNWTLVDTNTNTSNKAFMIEYSYFPEHIQYAFKVNWPGLNYMCVANYMDRHSSNSTQDNYTVVADLTSFYPAFNHHYRVNATIRRKSLDWRSHLSSSLLDWTINTTVNESKHLQIKQIAAFNGKLPFFRVVFKYNTSFTLPGKNLDVSLLVNSPEWLNCNIFYEMRNESQITITVKRQEKNKEISDWTTRINLIEPNRFQISIDWNKSHTKNIRSFIQKQLSAFTEGISVVGNNMANNIHRNVSDMVIPFTNKTFYSVVSPYVYDTTQMSPNVAAYINKSGVTFLRDRCVLAYKKVRELWRNSMIEKTVDMFGLRGALSMGMSAASNYISRLPNHPPAVYKSHIEPVLQTIMEKHSYNYTTTAPGPVVLQSFSFESLIFPHVTRNYKLLFHTVFRLRQCCWRCSWSFPTTEHVAALYGKGLIHTFDGTTYQIPGKRKGDCVYLLAADFKYQTFALVLRKDDVTVITDNAVISLKSDGRIEVIGDNKVKALPMSTPAWQLMLQDGSIQLNTFFGLTLIYNPVDALYIIKISSVNQVPSRGLLGEIDVKRTPVDFYMKDGNIAKNKANFINRFDVSKKDKCEPVSGFEQIPVPRVTDACVNKQVEFCEYFFHGSYDGIKTCFRYVKPDAYRKTCRDHAAKCTSSDPLPSHKVCTVIRSYIHVCKLHRRSLRTSFKQCNCSASEDEKSLDIVFVSSFHRSLSKKQGPNRYMRNLVKEMPTSDMRFGLVTFSAKDHPYQPKAHLLHGRLFGNSKDMLYALAEKRSYGVYTRSAFGALELAANYPYRPYARKCVILLLEKQALTSIHWYLSRIKQVFERKGILLVIFSNSNVFKGKSMLGITWDGKAIGSKKNGINVTAELRETSYIELVKSTKGSLLNVDILVDGKYRQLQQTVQHILQLRAHSPSPATKSCNL